MGIEIEVGVNVNVNVTDYVIYWHKERRFVGVGRWGNGWMDGWMDGYKAGNVRYLTRGPK